MLLATHVLAERLSGFPRGQECMTRGTTFGTKQLQVEEPRQCIHEARPFPEVSLEFGMIVVGHRQVRDEYEHVNGDDR